MLDSTTRALATKCLNIVIQAALVGAAFIGLLIVSLLVNQALQFVFMQFGVGENTQRILSFITLGYFFIVGVAIMVTSVNDVVRVVKASLRSSGNVEDGQ